MGYWFRFQKKIPVWKPLTWQGYSIYGLFVVLLVVFTFYIPFESFGRGVSFFLSFVHLVLIFIYIAELKAENPRFLERFSQK